MFRPTKRQRIVCPPSWMDCETLETVPAPPSPPLSLVFSSTNTSCGSDYGEPNNIDSKNNNKSDITPLMITTPLATELTRDIFLDRFQKEIVQKYQLSLSSKRRLKDADEKDPSNIISNTSSSSSFVTSTTKEKNDQQQQQQTRAPSRHARLLLRERLAVGINECTRVLEAAAAAAAACGSNETRTMAPPAPLLLVVAAEGFRRLSASTTNSTSTKNSNILLLSHIPVLARQLRVPILHLPSSSSSTSRDLGRLLGMKRACIVAFLSRRSSSRQENDTQDDSRATSSATSGSSKETRHGLTTIKTLSLKGEEEEKSAALRLEAQAHADLDSFVDFIINKVAVVQEEEEEGKIV